MAQKLKFSSQGHGQSLVFLHGWGLNAGIWQPVAQRLSQHFHVVTVDLPGFGNSVDCTVNDYDLKKVCSLVAEVIEQPSVIIGWSMGGLIATELALSYPEKVTALVTVASSPMFVERDQWHGIKANVLASFHRQLSDDVAKTIDGFLKIQAMGSPQLKHDIKQIRDLVMKQPMATRDTLDQSLNLLSDCDLRQQLVNIQQPFLRLYGKSDSLVPRRAIADIAKLAPQSQQHVFEQASHAPFISDFDSFCQTLITWLGANTTGNNA